MSINKAILAVFDFLLFCIFLITAFWSTGQKNICGSTSDAECIVTTYSVGLVIFLANAIIYITHSTSPLWRIVVKKSIATLAVLLVALLIT